MVLDLREGVDMSEPIVLNLEVEVLEEEGIATLKCPAELRITERVAAVLHEAVAARGLKLKRWSITEDQRKDLEGLSNVEMGATEK